MSLNGELMSEVTTTERHNEPYPLEKRAEVVRLIQKTGNIRIASELAGVPYGTILDWKKRDWWPQVWSEAKAEQQTELQSKLSGITEAALEVMQDRLQNGDWILNNKTGELVRKPIGLRDANQAMNNLITRTNEIERVRQTATVANENTQDILKKLASELAKFSKKKNTDVIDVEVRDVYESTPGTDSMDSKEL
jgi:hypothetical protein